MTYFNFGDDDWTCWIKGIVSWPKEEEKDLCDNHCEDCDFFNFATEECMLEEGKE